jgi:hypothetical protein
MMPARSTSTPALVLRKLEHLRSGGGSLSELDVRILTALEPIILIDDSEGSSSANTRKIAAAVAHQIDELCPPMSDDVEFFLWSLWGTIYSFIVAAPYDHQIQDAFVVFLEELRLRARGTAKIWHVC